MLVAAATTGVRGDFFSAPATTSVHGEMPAAPVTAATPGAMLPLPATVGVPGAILPAPATTSLHGEMPAAPATTSVHGEMPAAPATAAIPGEMIPAPATVAPTGDYLAAPASSGARGSPFRPLPFSYDIYTFRGEGSRTTVVAAFAVEAGNLETTSVGANKRFRFSVNLVLADTVLRSVTNRHDTVSAELPRRLSDEHLLYTHIEVQAPPSDDVQQRLTVIDATEAGIGQMYTEPTRVPDYSGPELMLSDVALGRPEVSSGWTRGETTLALLPTSRFPSSAFDVYYEIYNLPVGNSYTTVVTVERVEGPSGGGSQGREPVQLHFTGESAATADGTLAELRRVETSLAEGSYRITVAVEDLGTGRTASRSRTFQIQDSWRGATMVPAHQVQPQRW